jgi:polysaccharide export outer membrane protein
MVHLRRRALLTGGPILLVQAACGPNVREMPPKLAKGATEAYQLAVGDRVRIAVFGYPEHTGKFQIDGGGNINFPLIGEVEAAGQTVNALNQTITEQLDENYLVNPNVSVEVLTYRPFYILGEVSDAGKYQYTPDLTVRQAIALAGGFTQRAATGNILLRRPSADGVKTYRAPLDAKILPGDTIEVQRRLF